MKYPFDIHLENGAFRWPDDVPWPDRMTDGSLGWEIETTGYPHHSIRKILALAVEIVAQDTVGHHFTVCRVHGDRTMSDSVESGFQREGHVSIAGRKRRAFTGHMYVVRRDSEGKDRFYDFAVLWVAGGPS